MAAKKEILGINVPVRVGIDKTSVSKLLRDLAAINKQMSPLDREFTKLAKTSQQNVKEIQSISAAAGTFAKKLSQATKDSVKQLQKLGSELKEASEKAEELESAYGSASGEAEKSKVAEQLNKMRDRMAGANKAIEDYRKSNFRANREIQNTIKGQQKYQNALKQMASYTGKDAMKGAGDGLLRAMKGDLKGGFGDIFKSVGKGVQGKAARVAESKAAASGGGDAAMASAGADIAAAAGAMAGAAAAITIFIKLLLSASDHMTQLNKTLLSGTGLANEFGSSANDYAASIKRIRNASIDASGSLLRFGGDSETAMKSVNAFTKEASGSIIRTEIQLRSLGGGDLGAGIAKFTQQALIYGKALGMEVTEVTGLMGKMVGEIGMDADSVQKTMGNIVKQASQAGMPVNKFMGIFKEAIPNLDLFTNRIEELTGTIKLLSKTMDPRAVKGFMQAFGKGFDQLDFKQRLKMALVIGPGEMGQIMKKDIKRASSAVRNELPESLQAAFDDALKGGNSVNKMAKVAANAAAMGVDGAKIGNMTKLARYKQNASTGDPLKMASGMRDMGMMGRMEALEKYAGRFTGGDISGLGEHVAKQLGVSEQEYKAILDLKASMGVHLASVAEDGMTSSASINKNLIKILKQDRKNGDKLSDDEAKKILKDMATKNPGQLQSYIQEAATLQMDADADLAKKQQDELESMEDLAAEQINATTSISDKITNIIKVILEKIYQVIDSVLGELGNIYDMMPNWLSNSTDAGQKMLTSYSSNAKKDLGPNNDAGTKYYVETNNLLKQMLKDGKNTSQILNANGDLAKILNKDMAKNNPGEIKKLLSGIMNESQQDYVIKQLQSDDPKAATDLSNFLNNPMVLNKDQAADLASRASFGAAKGMGGAKQTDFGYGTKETDQKKLQRRDLRQQQEAKAIGDLDKDKLAAMAARGGPQGDEATKKLAEIADYEKKAAEEKQKAEAKAKAQGASPAAAAAAGSGSASPTAAAAPDAAASAKAVDTTARATENQLALQEDAEKKAEKDYQNTSDVLSLLKKGIKFEQSWMTQKYKSVVKDATLDAFRPALAEFLIAYMRAWNDEAYRKAVSEDPNVGLLDLTTISQQKTAEELKAAAAKAKIDQHAAGGVASYTGLHTLTAGERILPSGQSGGSVSEGTKIIHVGGIHISGAQDPQATANAVDRRLDEIARRH